MSREMPWSEQVFEERLSGHLDGLYRTALRIAGTERGAAELLVEAVGRTADALLRELTGPLFRLHLFEALLREVRWGAPAGVIAPSGEARAAFDLARVSDADLLAAIDALELPFRLALWLHDVEGFTMHEVARLLGLSRREAMTCLYGARAAVQTSLARAGGRSRELRA